MAESDSFHVDMKADCSRCAALCCAAFAFDRSDMFAIEKPVDTACPNLKPDFSCMIHADRERLGFKGCMLFDCHGAGQRATALYAGQDWRRDKAVTAEFFENFRKMLKIHDYLRLILALEKLPLSDHERAEVARFKADLAPQQDWTRSSLDAFEIMRVITAFEIFAAGLKDSPAGKALRARFNQ
jgi:hypothetical protein